MTVAKRSEFESIVVRSKDDTKVRMISKSRPEFDSPPTGKIVIKFGCRTGEIGETHGYSTQSLCEVGAGRECAPKLGDVVLDIPGLSRRLEILQRFEELANRVDGCAHALQQP
jgi:hypothetical protein